MSASAGEADHARQPRGRPRAARRLRLDRRGGRRARSTSSRTSTARSTACASRARSSPRNTSTIPLAKLIDGLPEELRARLPDHPLLQPAALHAAARAGRRPGARGRRRSTAMRAFADVAARQERRRLQGHAGLHRQPHRHLLDRERRSARRSTSA